MNEPRQPYPTQNAPLLFSRPVVVPQGDGSVLIRPGRPQAWLTVREFAAQVGLSDDSIYRYIGSEYLPIQLPPPADQPRSAPTLFVMRSGKSKLRIAAAAVDYFLQVGTRDLRN